MAAAYEAFVLKHASRLNTFESIAQVCWSRAHPSDPARPTAPCHQLPDAGAAAWCADGAANGGGAHCAGERDGAGMDEHGALTNPG
jgi:hypothetical protein